MIRLSSKLKVAIKLSAAPAYTIALQANLHPSMLSKLLHGAEQVKPHDARIIAIGNILGLEPEECFEIIS